VTAAEVSAALARRSLGARRPAPLGPVAQAAALEALSPESVLVAREHLDLLVRTDDRSGELVLTLAGRSVGLPGLWTKALRSLLDGAPLRVEELPDLARDEAMACARRLVREGVVAVDGTR
jgi:bifunctional lysine-specific demethylase and histidyl-hydroxylase NO66